MSQDMRKNVMKSASVCILVLMNVHLLEQRRKDALAILCKKERAEITMLMHA
jgi:hypothetical protein